MKVGVIGVGVAGTSHLCDLASSKRFTVVAVCAAHRERAAQAAQAFGVPAAYDDVRAMLAQTPLDGLVVAVPPDVSASILPVVLQLSVPILIDKPAAPAADALRQLVINADPTTASRVVVAYNRRYHHAVRQARHALSSGAIGAPVRVTCRWTGPFRQRYETGATYRRNTGWGHGVVLDTASHIVDALRFLGFDGLVVRRARLVAGNTRADTEARLELFSPDDAPIAVSIDDDDDEASRITVRGEHGSIMLTGTGVEMRPAEHLVPIPARDLGRPVDDLLRIARGEPIVGATLADAVAALAVIDQARSAAGRAALPWRRPRAKALGRLNGAC
jgi:predicted dehydrogenase